MGVCGNDYVVLGVCYVEGGEKGDLDEDSGEEGRGIRENVNVQVAEAGWVIRMNPLSLSNVVSSCMLLPVIIRLQGY